MTDSFILKENYEKNLSKAFDFSFVKQFEEFMTERMLELNPVSEIKGANRMIEGLIKQSNYAFCCATGSFHKPALVKLQQANIDCPKELVVGSNHFFTREEIMQKAINKAQRVYKVEKFNNIISIGDGIWDLNTASNLGVHFIGIGESNKNEFLRENIKYHIDDWRTFDLGEMELKIEINNIEYTNK